jgi:aryl-alcohol dehydrogenase-like predicted oxidoreductase
MNITDRIVLGTVQMGLAYGINNSQGKIKKKDAEEILLFCKQNGLEYLDTGNAYGDAEAVIGDIARKNNLSLKIITKLSKCHVDEIESVIDKSYRDLQTKKLYGYLCHHFDFFMAFPRIWNCFEKLKRDDRTEKIGFSLYEPAQLEWLLDRHEEIAVDLIQIPVNVFDRRFEPYLERCKEKNIEVHIRSVFLQGLFFQKPENLPKHFYSLAKKLQQLQQFAFDSELPLAHLLILAVLHICPDAKLVLGVDSIHNLKHNLEVQKYLSNNIDYDYLDIFIETNRDLILPTLWKI